MVLQSMELQIQIQNNQKIYRQGDDLKKLHFLRCCFYFS